MNSSTNMLFPRPSLIEGIARIFDFAGAMNLSNVSRSAGEADAQAMNADWAATGKDLWAAVERAEHEFVSRDSDVSPHSISVR